VSKLAAQLYSFGESKARHLHHHGFSEHLHHEHLLAGLEHLGSLDGTSAKLYNGDYRGDPPVRRWL
jgi:hypothetical protein